MKQLSFGLTTANLGFEEKLWQAANSLRNKIDPSDYKYIVLGLLFLKHVSDNGSNIQVPRNASWQSIKDGLSVKGLSNLVDEAMSLLEEANESLKNSLPQIYAKANIDDGVLADLILLIDEISFNGDSKDVLGRVYEYFIGKFAGIEGNAGGEYFTPQSVVGLLVNMIEPYDGIVYDPCCGTGGMFIQSEKFVEEHGGKLGDIKIYGQELNQNTWRLCKMNLKIRGLEGNLGNKNADSFHQDLHPNLVADYILANPPFNVSDWGGNKLVKDQRWIYGIPPTGNANFAWVQHIIYHLSDNGFAGFVLSNGSLSTNHDRSEGEIRRRLIEADLVDCIVSLPNQLFYTTQISASLWFITKNKNKKRYRDRRSNTLFIYAQDLGKHVDRVHRELTDNDITKITKAYHSWRKKDGNYRDISGFCKSATINEIKEHKWALVPGRYVAFSGGSSKTLKVSALKSEIEEAEDSIRLVANIMSKSIKQLKELVYG